MCIAVGMIRPVSNQFPIDIPYIVEQRIEEKKKQPKKPGNLFGGAAYESPRSNGKEEEAAKKEQAQKEKEAQEQKEREAEKKRLQEEENKRKLQ